MDGGIHDNTRNMKTPCPAPDELAAFANGELQGAALTSIQAHVSHCDACLETVGYLTSKVSKPESGEITHAALAEAGQAIGPYKLLRRLGEGGMGEVWEAQQSVPVRRTVALKLLKAGMDTRQIVTRFEAERQVLALMQHPSIAQVFDAGITDQGRPYFVMELVEGVRITAYCDQHNLGLQERLRLFQQVCEAIQHAHQRGVIHRDLKPSNVLVMQQGDKPLPKVIDFGLAKAISQDDADHSLTELGTVLGTPAYASPEQMGLGAKDIDTRTDVYSLGVLLYELLVGVIPYNFDKAKPSAIVDLRQAVRDSDPAKPSTRFSSLGDRASEIAKARNTEVNLLRKQLRGDLDWVVMKALEKDRERRYTSPHEFSLDIDRYLNHEPVIARSPTAGYRVGKFVRRHRLGTAFAASVAALVIGFVVVTIVQANRIAAERDRATAEAAKANAINRFMEETLGSADPYQTGKEISIREVLGRAVKKAEIDFKGQPLVEAAVKDTIGRVYANTGPLQEGERLLRESLDVRRQLLGEHNAEVAESLHDLASALQLRQQSEECNRYVQEAIKIRRDLFGEHSAEAADSYRLAGLCLRGMGKHEESARDYQKALQISEEIFGKDSLQVADVLEAIGVNTDQATDDPKQAEQYLLRALAIHTKSSGADGVAVAGVHNTLAVLYIPLRRNADAEMHARLAMEIYAKEYGPEDPNTLISKANLSTSLSALGRYTEASTLLNETVEPLKRQFGERSPMVTNTIINLAILESRSGNQAAAAHSFQEALARAAETYGVKHQLYSVVQVHYGRFLRTTGKTSSAVSYIRQALAHQETSLPAESASLAVTRYELGITLLELKLYSEAESLLLRSHATFLKQLGDDNVQTNDAAKALFRLYTELGRKDKAAAFDLSRGQR